MADYTYAEDGKLHTRYSELVRCTPGQVDKVVLERSGARTRVETDDMQFGIVRHEMWAQEALKTRQPYHAFGLGWPVSHVEQEFTTEMLPGVVVHSRLDLLCERLAILPDYKTVVDGKRGWRQVVGDYRHATKQRQLNFYAFQVGVHGIRIREGAFLCEIWNHRRDTILGYEVVRFPITSMDIVRVLPWVKQRVAMLAAALEQAPSWNDVTPVTVDPSFAIPQDAR
jgi:hypothetical protein